MAQGAIFPTSFQWNLLPSVCFLGHGSGALVVATHGIVKKTRKTPGKEIEKAERIRQEYFKDKK